ncbi:Na/Pi cotransporter family protein [Rhodopila sp.]|uniref:Na/Pi cotransporter family protein n=1 Tax=Rhodopila sp. TaxID=2480087 RepID=UPI002BC475C9|nr:Na/Pi symporter [Rhodopila sp.]HVZ10608.1 Na/Pi symporter [Rhodopila sp.]
MDTAIAVLGGVGLFLLGMTIMTDGLKGLAGSSLRAVLGQAAATPLSGAFWGAVVTLIVQSSSATTMTTIGLVSAGLLTFPQGLGLVFGANVGTTGTGWLVALIGVRVSLSAYALPLIFAGAMARLLGKGRFAAAGAALAGFALVLYGLTTLQQGMGGVAEQLHPSDLPTVLGMPGTGFLPGLLGLVSLVVTGLVMTAVMQSSTAAIAVTLSAFHAGAIGLEQGCALIIGQNIGTATSSALAAIGASTTAKRLAVAYVLFKIVAAVIAIVLFPLTVRFLAGATGIADGATLLAAYHTAYNVVGVAVLMPAIDRFTRLVERLLPETRTPLLRGLDPAAQDNPVVAVEAARRTMALAIAAMAPRIEAMMTGAPQTAPATVTDAATALRQARDFLADLAGPPDSEDETRRRTSTLHALDHASRLAETAAEKPALDVRSGDADEARAAGLCADAMRRAAAAVGEIAQEAALSDAAAPIRTLDPPDADAALAGLRDRARDLAALRQAHRAPTLARAGSGTITVEEALRRIDAVRRAESLARHAWRAVAHLLGQAGEAEADP